MVDFCIDLPGCTLCWTIGPDGNAVVSVGDYGATKRRTWATCVFYALEKADPVIAVLDEEKFDAGLENLVQDVIGIIRQAAKWLY
jgi:predicted site-specific integrase-resolvase